MSQYTQLIRYFQPLEDKLGYQFTNDRLLATALTHKSYAHLHNIADNERLEFLGDSIIGAVVTAELYKKYPSLNEGDLTKLRSAIVSRANLGTIGRGLKLENCLFYCGPLISISDTLISNAMEAIFAAMFLDSGSLQPITTFVLNQNMLDAKQTPDYKTLLQERLGALNLIPIYTIYGENGPQHDRTYYAKVVAWALYFYGQGKSKKEAEQEAAKSMLKGHKWL